MSCEEFELSVHEVESRRGAQPLGYAEHLRECAACVAYVSRQREVSEGLALLSASLDDEGGDMAEARLRRAFLDRRQAMGGRRARSRGWAWAAAAVVLIAVLIGWRQGGSGERARTDPRPAVFYALPGMPLDEDPGARVMRVRVPRAELRRWGMTVSGRGEVVEAEVLVGIDGLPRGVRVDQIIEQ